MSNSNNNIMFSGEEDWETNDTEKKTEDILLNFIKLNNHEQLLKALRGLDLNTFVCVDAEQDTTPLLFAISENNLECVKALLGSNASANFGWRMVRNDPQSFTRPLHYAITLNSSPEIIDALLESRTADLASTDGKNDTPLTLAISSGHENIIRQLLQRKDRLNVLDDICWLIKMGREIHLSYWKDTGIEKHLFQGRSADQLANCACYYGLQELLQSLKLNNYSINKRFSCHINEPPIPFIEHNFTLLHVAVLGQQEHLIDFLIKNGCDVDAEDCSGHTSIHCAAFVGNLSLLKRLLYWNVDVSKRTRDGVLALHIAVENGHVDFVQKLVNLRSFAAFELSRVKNKPRKKCNDPLALAIFLKNYEITRLLLESSGQLESLQELHYCISEGNAKLANLVVSHLDDDSSSKLDNDTIDGIPSLHLLSDARIILEEDIREFSALVRYYILKGYDVNKRSITFKSKKRSAAGFSALLAAVDRKNVNLVKILIENGADVNVADDDGYSALHWCALVNDSCIMEILLSSGADYSVVTKAQLPVIHVAADEGHLEVVQTLLLLDIDMINWKAKYKGFLQPDEVDKYRCRYNLDVVGDEVKYCTPFQRAVYMSKVDVCKLLIMSGSQLNGLEELHYSVRQGDIPIANVLLSYISTDTSLANDKIKNEPALSCLPCRCLIDYTDDIPKFLQAYMMRGYNINALSRTNHCTCELTRRLKIKNVSLLHLAVLHENSEMVEFLANNGANVDLRTERGHTPLFLAVYLKCPISIFLSLKDKGADMDLMGEVGMSRILNTCRENNPNAIVPTEWRSPIGVSIINQNKHAFELLFKGNAKLNGLSELNLAMNIGNVQAGLKILKRLPSDIPLAQAEYCFCGTEPLLHHLVKRCKDLDQQEVVDAMREFIKEYAMRGYNVNYNGTNENVKPLLIVLLELCIVNRDSKILNVITSVEDWNPNVKFLGQTALSIFFSRLSFEGLNCNHKSQYGMKFCAIDCALTLLKYGADGTQCTVALTHSQHITRWKILVTFGVKVIFTNYGENTSEALYSYVEKNNNSVKKLKHLSRLAIRNIHPVQLEILGANYLPMELKRYLYFEKLCPAANERVGFGSLELDSSIHDSISKC